MKRFPSSGHNPCGYREFAPTGLRSSSATKGNITVTKRAQSAGSVLQVKRKGVLRPPPARGPERGIGPGHDRECVVGPNKCRVVPRSPDATQFGGPKLFRSAAFSLETFGLGGGAVRRPRHN